MKKNPRKEDKKPASNAPRKTRAAAPKAPQPAKKPRPSAAPAAAQPTVPKAARETQRASPPKQIQKPSPARLIPPQTAASAPSSSTVQQPSGKEALPKTLPQPGADLKAKKPKRRLASTQTAQEIKVPSILLEGDLPPAPAVSGPGLRYALAPQPVISSKQADIGELPEAYGTGRIFLAARDPHWLYASWDFTTEQQKELNARSRDGHLVLRIFAENEKSPAVPEVHVHPESRNWFVNVPRAETKYWAEIGFYDRTRNWQSVSISRPTFAPPDAPSADVTAEFATIPPQVTFKQLLEVVEQFVTTTEGQPLLEAVAEAQQQEERAQTGQAVSAAEPRHEDRAGFVPAARPGPGRKRPAIPVRIEPGRPWGRQQRAALKRLIHVDQRRRVFLGSIEITELVRRQLEEEWGEEELASIAAQEARGVPRELRAEVPGAGISSPLGGELPRLRARKFWFKVNAELIIYGATEPDAKVTVADRPIKLRPDGTFSFRFSLPDGRYQLPAVAVSGDGEEAREAQLEFARSTEYRGRVEAHPQDAALLPPRAENIQ